MRKRFNHGIMRLKYFFISVFLLISAGCATAGYDRGFSTVSAAGCVDINDFCRMHNMQYSYDTLDDMVKMFSGDKEIRLVLNSPVGYNNGSLFYLKNTPSYQNGKILLPLEVEKFIFSQDIKFVRSAFSIKTIVIDAGHGGKDPGAVSSAGIKEKNINLAVAKYLEKNLKRRGFNVVMTRSTDKFLELADRVRVAKKCNADLFVSVHANANHSKSMTGAEIYYLSPARFDSLNRAMSLAKTDYFGRDNLNKEIQAILWDLLLGRNYALSVEFAGTLYSSFKNMGIKIAYPKKGPYYVLRLAYTPSVLVETGYLSNRYEAKLLQKKYYQEQLAEAIAMGVASLNNRYVALAHK